MNAVVLHQWDISPLCRNLTMAAWSYEQSGQRSGRAVVINLGNAAMCAATLELIAAHRGRPF